MIGKSKLAKEISHGDMILAAEQAKSAIEAGPDDLITYIRVIGLSVQKLLEEHVVDWDDLMSIGLEPEEISDLP
jgi:hypothetical protein